MRTRVMLGLFFAAALGARAEDVLDLKAPQIYLWPKGAPGSEGVTAKEEWLPSTDGIHRVRNIHNPSITVFLPPKEKATGVAFVICPGGGHSHLTMDLEGSRVALRLNRAGIAGFVLKSRLAQTEGYHYKVEVHSLQDAQRAIRLVRSRAKEWNVDPGRVGIMGFSAGGEIAALAETRFDAGRADSDDAVERFSSRPDIAVLGYPGLQASLGFVPGHFEGMVPKNAPPTFLVVNNDDNLAPLSAEFYVALKKAGVPAELHIYNQGGHGFGMTGRTPAFEKLPVSHWPDRLLDWMVDRGFLLDAR